MTTLVEIALRAGQSAGGEMGQAAPLAIALVVFLFMVIAQRRLFAH